MVPGGAIGARAITACLVVSCSNWDTVRVGLRRLWYEQAGRTCDAAQAYFRAKLKNSASFDRIRMPGGVSVLIWDSPSRHCKCTVADTQCSMSLFAFTLQAFLNHKVAASSSCCAQP